MPVNERTVRCPLTKPDGTPCRRGIGEGVYTCSWHCRTPEGQAFNKKMRMHRFLLDEAEHELRRAERVALDCVISWSIAPDVNESSLRLVAERLRKARADVDELKRKRSLDDDDK